MLDNTVAIVSVLLANDSITFDTSSIFDASSTISCLDILITRLISIRLASTAPAIFAASFAFWATSLMVTLTSFKVEEMCAVFSSLNLTLSSVVSVYRRKLVATSRNFTLDVVT